MTVCSKKGYNTIITDEMTADPFMGDAKCGSRFTLPEGYKELGMIAPSGPVMPFLLYENPRRLLLVAGAFLHKKLKKRRNVYVQPEPKEMLLCVLPSGNQMDPAEEERKVDPGRAGRCLLCP